MIRASVDIGGLAGIVTLYLAVAERFGWWPSRRVTDAEAAPRLTRAQMRRRAADRYLAALPER